MIAPPAAPTAPGDAYPGLPPIDPYVIWAYEMEGVWSDSEDDDPIDEAVVDDVFAMYYGE